MDKIKNLLQQVSIIQKKYDDLAEYSGEHYNVFDILGVRSDELSHSAILTNLLDAKGRHGQKDIFLKLFIEQIHPLLEKSRYSEYINSFETENATAKKEIHIGGVKHETAEGGRVDIVVSSGNKHLVIENKIYAGDQDQQLLRYDNHYKNDPIIYLTRLGSEPSPTSKGDLVLGIDFICISYHTDISNWLEQCIKEMSNKPIIRETLNQYLFLIKSLTNQSNNNKMSEEIINIVLKDESNFEVFKEIYNVKNKILPYIFEKKLFPLIEVISKSHNLDSVIDKKAFLNMNGRWLGFSFTNENLNNKNIKITFAFNVTNGFRELIYGFNYKNIELKGNHDYIGLKDNFNKIIKKPLETPGWPCFTHLDEYRNWEDINTMQKILYSNFEETITEKIDLLLEVSKNSFSN